MTTAGAVVKDTDSGVAADVDADASTLSAAETYADGVGTAAQAFASGLAVRFATVTIDYTELQALGAGVKTFSKNVGAIPPTGSRLAWLIVGSGTFANFDDATHGNEFYLTMGPAAGEALLGGLIGAQPLIGQALHVGVSGFPLSWHDLDHSGKVGGTASPDGEVFATLQHLQYQATIKTSGIDINTATAGHLVIELYYLPSVQTG